MRLVFAIMIYLSLGQYSYSQTFTITELAPLPMATSNNAVVEGFINGDPYVYSFGGIDETKIYSGIHLRAFRLDVNANEWIELDPLPDNEGKIASSASRVEDIIYIIGGYHVAANGSEISSAKVHRYDLINNVYLEDGQDIPVPIDDQVQVVKGKLIYVISGWSNTANKVNVQVYDTEADSWSSANPIPGGNSYRCFGSSGTIINDTIYYYGGAQGSGFPARNELRKGIISETDPLQIDWSLITPNNSLPSYRTASTNFNGQAAWIGGSEISYNFNGIAYNGSGGVPPSNKIRILDSSSIEQWIEKDVQVPMDLRSIADLNEREKIIVGGMIENQAVSNKTLLVTYNESSNTNELAKENSFRLQPNPTSDDFRILIDSERSLPYSIRIYSNSGILIETLKDVKNDALINTKDWPRGNYFIKIGEVVKKLVLTN